MPLTSTAAILQFQQFDRNSWNKHDVLSEARCASHGHGFDDDDDASPCSCSYWWTRVQRSSLKWCRYVSVRLSNRNEGVLLPYEEAMLEPTTANSKDSRLWILISAHSKKHKSVWIDPTRSSVKAAPKQGLHSITIKGICHQLATSCDSLQNQKNDTMNVVLLLSVFPGRGYPHCFGQKISSNYIKW